MTKEKILPQETLQSTENIKRELELIESCTEDAARLHDTWEERKSSAKKFLESVGSFITRHPKHPVKEIKNLANALTVVSHCLEDKSFRDEYKKLFLSVMQDIVKKCLDERSDISMPSKKSAFEESIEEVWKGARHRWAPYFEPRKVFNKKTGEFEAILTSSEDDEMTDQKLRLKLEQLFNNVIERSKREVIYLHDGTKVNSADLTEHWREMQNELLVEKKELNLRSMTEVWSKEVASFLADLYEINIGHEDNLKAIKEIAESIGFAFKELKPGSEDYIGWRKVRVEYVKPANVINIAIKNLKELWTEHLSNTASMLTIRPMISIVKKIEEDKEVMVIINEGMVVVRGNKEFEKQLLEQYK